MSTTPIVMSEDDIALATQAEEYIKEFEQEDIATSHIIHGNVYSRTILLKRDTTLAGALIKVPTILILSGDASVYIGSDVLHYVGYNVIVGYPNRKQIIHAESDVYVTMIMSTDAKSIKEAEIEFTDDWERLMSAQPDAENEVTITNIEKRSK